MNSKLFWLAIIGIILSFFGGFYLANSLNGKEMLRLQAENEQLKKGAPPAADSAANTLSDEEIRQRIAEADQNPSNVEFQKNLGLALLSYGIMKNNPNLVAESARLLERAHAADAKDFDVTVALGNAYYDTASMKKEPAGYVRAREFYAKALEQKPDAAAVRADFGSTFVFAVPPDYERATAEIQKALAQEPKNQRALLLMTQNLIRQNKSAEAEKYLAELRAINPQTPTLAELTRQMAGETAAGQN